MKDSKAMLKRALIFISMCCFSAPAIAACSKGELQQFDKLDDILVEYKELFEKARQAFGQATKSESRADAIRYCELEWEMNELSMEWLKLDSILKETCPIFFTEWLIEGKEARDLFLSNQPRHQVVVDGCLS